MSRYPRLRRVLGAAVLVALNASGSGCFLEDDCGGGPPSYRGGLALLDPDGTAPARAAEEAVRACIDGDNDACALACNMLAKQLAGELPAGADHFLLTTDRLRTDALRRCDVVIGSDERPTIDYTIALPPRGCGAVAGRRPAGLAVPGPITAATEQAGRWLATMAHLEEAAVYAFLILATDLKRLGAPRELVERAVESAADEVRHARITHVLARRYGAVPPRAELPRGPGNRPARDVLLENAREGCVRETYGAALAMYQAGAAEDPVVRDVMSEIAADELRHAELSWEIHRWARRTFPALADELDAALPEEAAGLAAELRQGNAPAACRPLGLPAPETQRALFADMCAQLALSQLA